MFLRVLNINLILKLLLSYNIIFWKRDHQEAEFIDFDSSYFLHNVFCFCFFLILNFPFNFWENLLYSFIDKKNYLHMFDKTVSSLPTFILPSVECMSK